MLGNQWRRRWAHLRAFWNVDHFSLPASWIVSEPLFIVFNADYHESRPMNSISSSSVPGQAGPTDLFICRTNLVLCYSSQYARKCSLWTMILCYRVIAREMKMGPISSTRRIVRTRDFRSDRISQTRRLSTLCHTILGLVIF